MSGDRPRPNGSAAQALVWDVWPQTSESGLDNLAAHHESLARAWNDHGDATKSAMYEQRASLIGGAGDAHQEAMQNHYNFAYDAGDYHHGIANSVRAYHAATVEFKHHLTQLAEEAEPAWRQAASSRVPGALAAVYSTYKGQVAEVQALAWGQLAEAPPQPSPPTPPDSKLGGHSTDKPTDKFGDATDPKKHDADAVSGKSADSDVGSGDQFSGAPSATDSAVNIDHSGSKPAVDAFGSAPNPDSITPAISARAGQLTPQMPSSPLGQGGSAGGGAGSGLGSGVSGLGSGLKPSTSMPATSGIGSAASSAGTSPASAVPKVPGSAPSAAGSPLASASNSFQSGLSSGMGSAGAMSPASAAGTAQPMSPVTGQHSGLVGPMAAGGAPAAASGGFLSGGDSSAASAGQSSAAAGGGSTPGGPPMVGGMPVSAAQPLAPYNQPGGGTPAGGSATTPATGPAQPGSSPAAGSGAPGSPAAPPMMTSGAGSSSASAALAASQREVNPDLLAAQRVLAELVRGTQVSGELRVISWAVSVLRTPVGPQTVIANSVGGGWYIPARVFVPTTARLAVIDPALPMGWAADLMGCPSPVRILVEHAERMGEVVAGVSVSAMVTSEPYPRFPQLSGDFAAAAAHELLQGAVEPPRMDGAHLHRLAVVDPGLAGRVRALDRGGEVSTFVAAHLTRAVMEAAFAPDDTGQPLAVQEDGEILEAVNAGIADEARWQVYQDGVQTRGQGAVLLPEIHAPQDFDGSPASEQARMFYRHYYRMGRIAELVNCWRTRPPNVADIAYCGIAAGFGAPLAGIVAAVEQHLNPKLAVPVRAG